jgi:hypothetical protein
VIEPTGGGSDLQALQPQDRWFSKIHMGAEMLETFFKGLQMVEEKTGNLKDLTALPGMPSQPSIERLMARRNDFPILQRGRKGIPYLFDLGKASAFIAANWRDGRNERSARPDMPELQF